MNDATNHESDPRFRIRADGQYRTGQGSKQQIEIREVWRNGCVFSQPRKAAKGSSIALRIGGFGPFDAVISHSDGSSTEATFVTPLYQPILEHISQTYAAKTPEARDFEFTRREPFDMFLKRPVW